MTVSHWRRNPAPREVEREVVVVGAGISGVSGALHLQRRGVPYVVVERHALASGASQRNAGFLMRGAADNYAAAVRDYGRERARLLWRWTEENLEGLREEGVARLPSYRAVPSCLLALGEPELGELRQSRAMLEADGFEVGWLDPPGNADTIWRSREARALGGLLNPGDGSVNPWDLMSMLSRTLSEPVVHNQEACEISEASGGALEVRTPDTRVRCRRVLVCTNAYGPLLLPSLAGLVTARRGQMIAVRAGAARLDCSYYANHGSEYLRQTPDGTIVIGGCRTYHADKEVGYDDTTSEWVQRDLERFGARMIGPGFTITARWSGTMAFSPDGLPLVGPVRGAWPAGSVWYCGGYTGHGMSLAYRTTRGAIEAMLDAAPNPFPLTRFEDGAEAATSPAGQRTKTGTMGAAGVTGARS